MPRELVALRVVFGIGDVFLGIFDVIGERRHVEVVTGDRAVGKNGQARGTHFGKAADDHDRLAPPLADNRDDAGRNDVTMGAWPGRMPMSPSLPGKSTWSTSPENKTVSGETNSKCSAAMLVLTLRRRASCPSRPPPRWCRPCRRRPPAGDRICPRPGP